MKKLAALLIVLLVLSACSSGPTADQLSATVNAQVASTLAAVPTNTPNPTDTSVPTATNTPRPTNTPKPTNTPRPTNTPAPTETPQVILDANTIMEVINALFKQDGVPAEIIDVKYESGLNKVNNILHIHIKSTAAKYDSTVAITAIAKIVQAIKEDLEFEGNLTALNVTAYDSKLNDKGLTVVNWQDMVDFAHGQITSKQLVSRIQQFP